MTLKEMIKVAIQEDIPNGDVTTESLGVAPRQGRARLIAKQDLVLSGSLPFEETMLFLEPNIKLKWHFEEGDAVLKGQSICTLMGDLIQILKAERTSINFLMKLTGIATYTNKFVNAVKGTAATILDTRKTTPGYRDLEKRAVIHGGAKNHRFNLSDALLVKDNHITLMGGITQAVKRIRQHSQLPLEVEAKNLAEVQECIDLKIARILLDNMDNNLLQKSRTIIPSQIKVEASGNMSLERVRSVAEIGVDYISVGALTHSAPSADVSLLFDWETST